LGFVVVAAAVFFCFFYLMYVIYELVFVFAWFVCYFGFGFGNDIGFYVCFFGLFVCSVLNWVQFWLLCLF
jgi:hypothetical protein